MPLPTARTFIYYSIFFGDFDRRYALGIAAHEVGHCLYTDFDSLDVYKENPTSLSDFFRLGSPGEFSLPLRGEDGAEEAYRLQSDSCGARPRVNTPSLKSVTATPLSCG